MNKNKNKNPLKLDAEESVFFERELEHIKATTYDVKHKQLKGVTGELIPIAADADTGAETITYRSYDMVGVAKIVADYSRDFPRVDTLGTEQSRKVKSLGDSYGYSIQEIRRSNMEGKSLDQRRANSAKRAIDELQNKIAFSGDSDAGLEGLIDASNITEYTIPDGAGGDSEWSTKTPVEIVADITGILTLIMESTNGLEVPDTMILPIEQYNILAYTDYGDSRDKTIMQYVTENFPTLNKIEWVTELKGAGDGGEDRMMVYVRDAEHLTLEIPQAFEQFPADKKGMEYEIVCHQRTAGVIVYYPASIGFGDGV